MTITTPKSKYVDFLVARRYSMGVSKRSQKVIITNEARVLRALRLEHRLSMREAGKAAGLSDSMIAHIETGRANPPKGERLERLLAVYGGIKAKSFYERVRRHQHEIGPKEELKQLVELMNDQQIGLLLPMVKVLLGDRGQPSI